MEKIEEQLKKLSIIKMTESERNRLKAGVVSYIVENTKVFHFPVHSPWSLKYAPLFTKITAAVLVFVVVGGGTLTFASENSLPGDTLYPIKIAVKENIIEGSLIHSPEDILNWQQKRLIRRIDEVKQLKKKGVITKKQAQVVTTVVKEHVSEIQSAISTLKDEGKSDVVLASAASLIPIVTSLDVTEDTAEEKIVEENSATTNENTSDESHEPTEDMALSTKMIVQDEEKDSDFILGEENSEDEKTEQTIESDEDVTESLEASLKVELKKIEEDVKAVAEDVTEEQEEVAADEEKPVADIEKNDIEDIEEDADEKPEILPSKTSVPLLPGITR